MMKVFMMHMSTILDPDAGVHDARMYVACVYDPRSLTLMHVWMMHIPMILDPDVFVYEAGMYDAYNHDAGFFRIGPTDGPMDGQVDSRSWI